LFLEGGVADILVLSLRKCSGVMDWEILHGTQDCLGVKKFKFK
jgi:hypothetical protein